MTTTTEMTTTTKVTRLTPLNVRALAEIGVAHVLGATFAVFLGTPGQVLGMIRSAETPETRRSLNAVVRKLVDNDPKFVTVGEAPSEPDEGVSTVETPGDDQQAEDDVSALVWRMLRERKTVEGSKITPGMVVGLIHSDVTVTKVRQTPGVTYAWGTTPEGRPAEFSLRSDHRLTLIDSPEQLTLVDLA